VRLLREIYRFTTGVLIWSGPRGASDLRALFGFAQYQDMSKFLRTVNGSEQLNSIRGDDGTWRAEFKKPLKKGEVSGLTAEKRH
jgi:hypothetical protein